MLFFILSEKTKSSATHQRMSSKQGSGQSKQYLITARSYKLASTTTLFYHKTCKNCKCLSFVNHNAHRTTCLEHWISQKCLVDVLKLYYKT